MRGRLFNAMVHCMSIVSCRVEKHSKTSLYNYIFSYQSKKSKEISCDIRYTIGERSRRVRFPFSSSDGELGEFLERNDRPLDGY